MEPLPTWLNDAVAAAGIAGVYTDFEDHVAEGDEQALPPSTH